MIVLEQCALENREHIFAVPVIDQYITYNPLNGRYALLNEGGISLLKAALKQSKATSLPEDYQDLAAYLTAAGVKHPEKTGPVNPQFLGIIPSRKCNMSCSYCDFGAHQNSGERLDPQQMVTAIDWFAELKKKAKVKRKYLSSFLAGNRLLNRNYSISQYIMQGI